MTFGPINKTLKRNRRDPKQKFNETMANTKPVYRC